MKGRDLTVALDPDQGSPHVHRVIHKYETRGASKDPHKYSICSRVVVEPA